jgi:hypothetical protein
MMARVENARYRRSLRGRFEEAVAQTAPWSEEREAVEAAFEAEVDRRIDERRERGDEPEEQR